ncbi:MAG: M28 family peptidase [Isosphaeraceae bacterium]
MPHTLFALVTAIAALGPSDKPSAPYNESIRQQDLRADLFFLAGDAFQGRLTDTPGNKLAAEFIASRFERMGLKGMGREGSYFQPFLLSTARLGTSNKIDVPINPGLGVQFRVGKDFVPLPLSPSAGVRSSVLFAGFGMSDPKRGHDDYRNLPQQFQPIQPIVLILAHEPGENDPKSPFDGLVMSEASLPLRKVLAAQEKGASGVLIVTDVHNHPEPENFEALAHSIWPDKPPRIPQYTLKDWIDQIHIPVAMISRELAQTILRVDKADLEEIARAGEHRREGWDAMPQYIASLDTDVIHHTVPDRNVVAAIVGCDPKLKDEWVIISCHVDHNGADGNQIFNGADDNGSGVAGLLEIAEAYSLAARQGHRPKRSVMFIAFNSEERGLLGAYAFTEHPLVPLEKIVAVLNMDMIGRNEEVPLGGGPQFHGLAVQTAESNRNALNLLGYSYTPSLAKVVEQANDPFGLTLKQNLDNNASNLLRRSDHWPFLQRGVPAVFIHTGLHPDYHTTADRPEKIEYAKMKHRPPGPPGKLAPRPGARPTEGGTEDRRG